MTDTDFGYQRQPAAQSLLQFTTNIGNAIRRCPELYSAWVTAEMVDLRLNGGHCYMELIEKNPAGSTVAKIRAMIWRSNLDAIRRKFYQATGRDIGNGLKVMVQATATHHPLYGLSLTITDIDPTYTLGDLERLRREILERLQREGLLNRNKEREMPIAPQRIAVVSAAGAAGYGDFINQLEGNQPGFVFYPVLFGAVMQGERTSESIRMALQRIEMTIDLWDCVVIIRGGGATTDMNGFDDYELAREVATFPLPIVVGIGHERDRCVLDEIAHTRCKTPTAVATFLVDTLAKAWQRAESTATAIARYASDRLAGENRRLAQASVALPSIASNRLEREKITLRHLSEALPLSVGRLTSSARGRLEADLNMLRLASANATERGRQHLTHLSELLRRAAPVPVSRQMEKLESLRTLVEALSPDNTLKRGYSMTLVDGKAVTDPSAVAPGTRIETIFKEGVINSIVESSSKRE